MRTPYKKRGYCFRYVTVIRDLSQIAKMQPRYKYMYKLMDKVVFNDFETALDGVMEDYKEANDNNKSTNAVSPKQ